MAKIKHQFNQNLGVNIFNVFKTSGCKDISIYPSFDNHLINNLDGLGEEEDYQDKTRNPINGRERNVSQGSSRERTEIYVHPFGDGVPGPEQFRYGEVEYQEISGQNKYPGLNKIAKILKGLAT